MPFVPDERILFTPTTGKPRPGVVRYDFQPRTAKVRVRLQGDTHDIHVAASQVQKVRNEMPLEEMTAKQLGIEAKSLGVPNWEEMSRVELEEAIAAITAPVPVSNGPVVSETNGHVPRPVEPEHTEAHKTVEKIAMPVSKPRRAVKKTKKTTAPAKAVRKAQKAPQRPVKATRRPKKAVKKMLPLENPFRPESNSWQYCQVLKKGGVRRKLAEQIRKRIELHPWSKKAGDVDEIAEIDKRIILVSQQLEARFGWHVTRVGRGIEGTIKAIPPRRRPRQN